MQHQERKFTDSGALWPFLSRLFTYSLRYKRWFWSFVGWMIVVAVADALFPLVVLSLVDRVLTPEVELLRQAREAGTTYNLPWQPLLLHAGVFLAIGLAQVVGVWAFIRFCGRIQEHVMYDMREELFLKLQRLPHAFFDRNAVGWLLTRLTSDTDRVTELISWGFIEAVWGLTMIVACLGAMFLYSWKLGMLVAIAIPVLMLVSVRIRMLILRWSRSSRKLNSEITASFNEHIGGVTLVKATGQQVRATSEFGGLSHAMRRASYKASWYTAMYMPLVIFIGSMATVGVVWWGGSMAVAVPAGITVGVLAASFDYSTKIFMPIMDISRFYALAQSSLSAGERIFGLIDEEVSIEDLPGTPDFEPMRGAIRFDHLSFRYDPDKPVLKELDLDIPAGQSVALVGPTGEGKSTMVKLIGRYYEATEGRLLIDGQDVRSRTMSSLRRQMGVVLQEPHLFSGTVRENVRFGKPGSSDGAVLGALEVLGADDLITRLDEEVGEGGSNLSEGERQIVSFARAVIAEPAIFIMDEATSAVDALTEARIQKGVDHLTRDRTSVIIAHRLSTIRRCDRILVIEGGRIVEDGNHAELLQRDGHYKRLYRRQAREEAKRLVEEA